MFEVDTWEELMSFASDDGNEDAQKTLIVSSAGFEETGPDALVVEGGALILSPTVILHHPELLNGASQLLRWLDQRIGSGRNVTVMLYARIDELDPILCKMEPSAVSVHLLAVAELLRLHFRPADFIALFDRAGSQQAIRHHIATRERLHSGEHTISAEKLQMIRALAERQSA